MTRDCPRRALYISFYDILSKLPFPIHMPIPKRPRSTADLAKSDYEALAAWRYELRLFLRFSEEAAASKGLSPQQHQALLAIKGFPGRECISIGELADKLQVRHHSAVGLVDRLVNDGLVAREESADDRRRVLITLTQRGQRILSKLTSTHRQELRRIGPAFRALLNRIAAH